MSNIMNPITKRAYKVEFETSNITKAELIKKYNIAPEQLGNTDSWEKRAGVGIVREDNYVRKDITALREKPEKKLVTEPQEPKDFLATIQETKELALTSTKQFFQDYDTDEVTTKEFKDMVGVLKDLEAGELVRQGKDTGPTVNILIQNLTEKFHDDC